MFGRPRGNPPKPPIIPPKPPASLKRSATLRALADLLRTVTPMSAETLRKLEQDHFFSQRAGDMELLLPVDGIAKVRITFIASTDFLAVMGRDLARVAMLHEHAIAVQGREGPPDK